MVIIDCWCNIAVRGHKIVWNRSWREIFLNWSRSWWRIFECRSRTSGLVVGSNQIMSVMMLVVTSWCCMVSTMITVMITMMTSSTMITMVTTSKAMLGWRRTYESSRFPEVWFFLCFILEDIRRERSSQLTSYQSHLMA